MKTIDETEGWNIIAEEWRKIYEAERRKKYGNGIDIDEWERKE